MATMKHVNPDDIRTLFSRAMSDMYRAEVPQYGALLELVADINDETLRRDRDLRASLERAGEFGRLSVDAMAPFVSEPRRSSSRSAASSRSWGCIRSAIMISRSLAFRSTRLRSGRSTTRRCGAIRSAFSLRSCGWN
jgi:Domain of unknown function (DUF1338)